MPAKTAFFAEWHRFPPIFPTADASPTFGMTREKGVIPNPPPRLPCHPEELATRDLQLRTQTGGWPKPEKTLQGIIAKL